MKLWHAPVRAAAGAMILNSGLSKRGMPEEAAAQLHGFASSAIPQVKQMEPTQFAKVLSTAEIALGGALLTPFVSTGLAGAGLTAFSAGLMQLYLNGPGLRQEGSIRPTQSGTAIAKDVWLLGMGTALLIDALTSKVSRKR